MQTETTQSSGTGSLKAGSGASSYQDDKISITLHTLRENNSTVYAAEVTVSDSALLKTALAQEAFGTNVVQRTSEIAQNHQAILAINGDYYGANSRGYVIKNGVIYRSSALRDSSQEDLAIFSDGSVKIIKESEVSAQELLDQGVVNLLSFGPVLVENGEITVSENDEVARSMASNPRTAIGFIDENHYIFLVSDGRTSESQGLSLYQLAQVMQSFGVKTAYNLDGGGSSTMYFNGNVVNQPTTSGWNIEEREVSDIVYIGY